MPHLFTKLFCFFWKKKIWDGICLYPIEPWELTSRLFKCYRYQFSSPYIVSIWAKLWECRIYLNVIDRTLSYQLIIYILPWNYRHSTSWSIRPWWNTISLGKQKWACLSYIHICLTWRKEIHPVSLPHWRLNSR